MEEKAKVVSYIREPSEGYLSEVEERAFIFLKNDPVQLRDDYIEKYKNEINPDAMRHLFEEYKGYNTRDFDRVVGALTEITYNYLLETQIGKENNTVFFTAGGSGSGKSRNIATLPQKSDYAIILDATFSSKNAVNKVKQALDKRFKVQIAYVLRDPLEAWTQGVLPRAKETGRIIDEAYHLESHKKARENILRLYEQYIISNQIEFEFSRNEIGEGLFKIEVEDLKNFTYNEIEVAKNMSKATDKAYEEEKLTPEQYEAIKATREA